MLTTVEQIVTAAHRDL